MGEITYKGPTASNGTMNHSKTSFSTEIRAGARYPWFSSSASLRVTICEGCVILELHSTSHGVSAPDDDDGFPPGEPTTCTTQDFFFVGTMPFRYPSLAKH
jgi:hypothetical protein